MITQTNVQGPESNSSDIIKDMSPQTNIHAPSFEDDEFEIPSVALPPLAMAEEKRLQQAVGEHQAGQAGLVAYHGQGYNEGFYQQQQQWLGDYNNHMSYHYNHGHHHQPQQPQYHNQYQPQHNYQYHSHSHHQQQHQGYHPGQEESCLYMTGLPARSPSGSHSTPSPHSQPDMGDGEHLGGGHQGVLHHSNDIKRPHSDFRTDNINISIQNPPKKPKVSRRKKKRDPHEPQKPVSAYALFFRDRQANIKSHNPNLSFGEVSKMVASMWDTLDAESKAHYKKRTELAKKDYLRQLAAYRASIVSKGHGEDMYGYMGYGNYTSIDNQGQMGQNIPPHPSPHPHGQPHPHPHGGPHGGPGGGPGYVNKTPDYLSHHQAAAHGTDISTGNQPGIPSLPPAGATPDAGNTSSPSPLCPPPEGSQSYCQDNANQAGQSAGPPGPPGPPGQQFVNSGMFSSYPGLGLAGGHDRNHNTPLSSQLAGGCARPGCGNLVVSKAGDGTDTTYCSSECVVGQCRDAYQGYNEQQQHQQHQQHQVRQTQQPAPAAVK